MAEAIGGSLASPTVPDAQDTIRDFMDYTDVFPADLIRSLTLIGKLDRNYQDATNEIHKLTSIYGSVPDLPAEERPDPQILRKKISATLDYAFYCRESAFAEATRLNEVAKRYDDRLGTIKRKLQALPEPPSRDPTPAPVSPQNKRKREADRAPRLTLHVDGARPRAGAQTGNQKQRKQIISASGDGASGAEGASAESSVESDWEGSRAESPVDIRQPGDRSTSVGQPGWTNGTSKPSKISKTLKAPKPPKVRPPGVLGTNVHSAIAGISTSNALAKLTPPPFDARPGSKHAPWHKLTEYEMAMLRKTMKKNAIWNPSDTMIRRELTKKNRGRENYEKAKATAEATGEPFLDEDPLDPTKTVFAPGEISFEPTGKDEEQLMNRGMKLNEAKKLKKETLAREQAARDAMEIEEASRAITDAGELVKNAFSKPIVRKNATANSQLGTQEAPTSSKKRKRKASLDTGNHESKDEPDSTTRPGPKRLKIVPPAPPGSSHASSPVLARNSGLMATSPSDRVVTKTTTTQVPLAPAGSTSARDTNASARQPATSNPPVPKTVSPTNPKKIPIPPPITAAASRSRRASFIPKQGESTTPSTAGDGGFSTIISLRPRSRAGEVASPTTTRMTGSGKKASSAEPPIKTESRELRNLRRMSNVSLPSPSENGSKATRNAGTPGVRASGRRSRRPAPGPVTAEEDGWKVSVGKRKAAPRKKGNAAAGKPGSKGKDADAIDTLATEVWDDADPIDPDEPRYCVCGDVSYGTMIACENDDCEKEWFHLECVGLTQIPPRRRKWYCEECRVALNINEEGFAANAPTLPTGRRGR